MRLKIISDVDSELLHYLYNAFDALKDTDENVDIDITSYGGDIFCGVAICEKIKEFQELGRKFTAYIYGIAASAAADIALCCDRVEMAESSSIMVHAAYRADGGKDRGLEIANAFQMNTIQRRNPDFKSQELKKDSWFTSYEALQAGLIDGVFNVSTNKIFKEAARLSREYLAKHIANTEYKYAAMAKDFVNSTEFLESPKENINVEKAQSSCVFQDSKRQPKEEAKMDEEKKEVIEEKKEVAEDQIDVSDLIERISERLKFIEDRLDAIEKGAEKAECGDNRNERQAKFKALYEKLGAVCKPAQRKDVVSKKEMTADEEFARSKSLYNDLSIYCDK